MHPSAWKRNSRKSTSTILHDSCLRGLPDLLRPAVYGIKRTQYVASVDKDAHSWVRTYAFPGPECSQLGLRRYSVLRNKRSLEVRFRALVTTAGPRRLVPLSINEHSLGVSSASKRARSESPKSIFGRLVVGMMCARDSS